MKCQKTEQGFARLVPAFNLFVELACRRRRRPVRIAVYAGSAEGNRPGYRIAAEEFAQLVVRNGHEIVYGGGAVGLMGVVANTALAAGGTVTGVIPKSLEDVEVAHRGLTTLHVVETMHERKRLMADLADCFIALPGGVGTVEELFEAWVLLLLGYQPKPILLLNVDGYWDGLLRMTGTMVTRGFLRPEEKRGLVSITSSDELFRVIEEWRPPPPRWRGER